MGLRAQNKILRALSRHVGKEVNAAAHPVRTYDNLLALKKHRCVRNVYLHKYVKTFSAVLFYLKVEIIYMSRIFAKVVVSTSVECAGGERT